MSSVDRVVTDCREAVAGVNRRFIDFLLAETDTPFWEEIRNSTTYVPASYTSGWNKYQKAYLNADGRRYSDVPILFLEGAKPIAAWLVGICDDGLRLRLATGEGSVRPPLMRCGITRNPEKNVIAQCLEIVKELCRVYGITEWSGVESLRGGGFDAWHKSLMEQGATCHIGHELYVDLSLTTEEIKANFRKSYRPLVNKGRKLWVSNLYYGHVPHEIFAEFRELHRQVAGKITRPMETWDCQEWAINLREAFLVTLRDRDNRMVGAGLFHVSRDEGVYAVGAYDRNLFDLPLGHVVQMEAIEHMKRLGLRWYLIGYRSYPGDIRKPTAKELSISHFKEGFATDTFAQFQMTVPVGVDSSLR